MIENIRFAAVTVSVSKIVSLVFTTRLSVHVTNVEVKSTLIFPLFVHLIGLQDSAKIFHEIRIHLTLGLTDYIISKKYCGLVVLLAAEDINRSFMRQSTIVGRKCLLRRLTL